MITFLRLIDEKDEDPSIGQLIYIILDTLSYFGEHLPKLHVMGLIHLIINHRNPQNHFHICQLATYLPEECRCRLMEILIPRIRDEPNVQIVDVIGQLSSWLTETQISSVLEYLSKFIFVNELSKNINCLVIAYGKVAAQSQHRALIFNRLIDDWKNSHSTQFRNRVLTIIGVMAKDICAEKSLDTIRVIHENANDQDNLTGLNDLNKNLSQIAQKHVDSAFQLFLTGLQDEKRENLKCADIEGLVQIHTLLSDGQRKVLLPLVIAQFNRPEKYSYKSVITLTYGLVKAFPEPERTQLLLDLFQF